MLDKLKSKKLLLSILAAVIVFVIIIIGAVNNYKQKKSEEKTDDTSVAIDTSSINVDVSKVETEDSLLMKMQDSLSKSYGIAPDNYVWNLDGTLLSLGDKNMSAEDVVYAYFNGLRSLDFSSVQKFSRDSSVVKTYSGYFDTSNKITDYADSFMRNVYRECLLSMEIVGIQNTSIFAENKQVFTIKISMLDLTKKDFWFDDKDEIYTNLKIYNSDQSDPTKAEMYLYDYINNYYTSDEAARREVTFDITLQKYPDLNTGWLVSIDTDVDSACRYADGKLVVNYITEMYSKEGLKYFQNQEYSNSVNKD